jgi:TonB family protein
MQEYNILKPFDQEMANFVLAAIQRPEKFVFGVVQGKLISTPKPAYPIEARKDYVSGRVTVQVEINAEGKVTKARAVSGPPELRAAAEAAARGARLHRTDYRDKR